MTALTITTLEAMAAELTTELDTEVRVVVEEYVNTEHGSQRIRCYVELADFDFARRVFAGDRLADRETAPGMRGPLEVRADVVATFRKHNYSRLEARVRELELELDRSEGRRLADASSRTAELATRKATIRRLERRVDTLEAAIAAGAERAEAELADGGTLDHRSYWNGAKNALAEVVATGLLEGAGLDVVVPSTQGAEVTS